MRRFVLCALVLALLGGCREATKLDIATITKELKQMENKWNRAYAAHDAAAVAVVYADDAALAHPGRPLVSGAKAIRQETQRLASDPNFRLQFASDRVEVAASGDLAYSRGHYTLTMTDSAAKGPSTSKGNYLTIWRRDRGSWRAAENFITPANGR